MKGFKMAVPGVHLSSLESEVPTVQFENIRRFIQAVYDLLERTIKRFEYEEITEALAYTMKSNMERDIEVFVLQQRIPGLRDALMAEIPRVLKEVLKPLEMDEEFYANTSTKSIQ